MEIKFQSSVTELKFELSILFYFFVVFIIYQLPAIVEPTIIHNSSLPWKSVINLGVLPFCFLLVNLLFYLILKKHIILRGFLMVLFGIFMGIAKFIETPSIIDPVYFFILSATCAVILGLYKGKYFSERLIKIKHFNALTEKSIDYIRDDYKYFLGKAFQGWLALGASLGVSMSILFKDDYQNPHLKFMALKMLMGFIFISIAVGYWVIIPLLNGITETETTLHNLTNNKNK